MEFTDILLKQPKIYIGYQLQAVYETSWSEKDIKHDWCPYSAKPLKNIPAKVGRFFDKTKIKKLWKTLCEKDPRDNWYFILTTDGTMFEAHY